MQCRAGTTKCRMRLSCLVVCLEGNEQSTFTLACATRSTRWPRAFRSQVFRFLCTDESQMASHVRQRPPTHFSLSLAFVVDRVRVQRNDKLKVCRTNELMKILFYNHTGQVSGAERVLLLILARIDREAFEAVVLCPERGPLSNMVSELGVPVQTV